MSKILALTVKFPLPMSERTYFGQEKGHSFRETAAGVEIELPPGRVLFAPWGNVAGVMRSRAIAPEVVIDARDYDRVAGEIATAICAEKPRANPAKKKATKKRGSR